MIWYFTEGGLGGKGLEILAGLYRVKGICAMWCIKVHAMDAREFACDLGAHGVFRMDEFDIAHLVACLRRGVLSKIFHGRHGGRWLSRVNQLI